MSEAGYLLVFLGGQLGWMRVLDGAIVARAAGFETLPDADGLDGERAETVVLVVPGVDVTFHWEDIPADLAPAQAEAAARVKAAEISPEPLDRLHFALGKADTRGRRAIALVARSRMEDWLAEAAGLGIDPDWVVPEPMLIAPPETGLKRFRRAGLDNVRGPERAFAAEREIAALLMDGEEIVVMATEDFDREVGDVLEDGPLNLRQGLFRKRRPWKVESGAVRRIAMLVGAILLATLLIQLVLIARYNFAADALEREAIARARDVIPGNVEIVDPEAQLRERLYGIGAGPGYGEVAGAAFVAVRDTAGVELQALVFQSDNSLQLTAAAPGQPELSALQQRLTELGLAVTPGAMRDGGGRQIGEFTVRAP